MTIASETVMWLKARGVEFSEAMSGFELAAIEASYGFRFGPDHRELLMTGVPVGQSWMDWRESSEDTIKSQLDWPVEGVLFDVESNAFWPPSWGVRPALLADALRLAHVELLTWPTLVPLCGHRYMPAGPSESGAPVFSVYQTDVIYYGENLLSYVKTEFDREPPTGRDAGYLPPWSLVACGVEVP